MGFIVGLSGIDGSGKTTVANLLVDNLKSRGVKVSYHHELDFFVLKPMFKLFAKIIGHGRAENAKAHTLQNVNGSTPVYADMYYFLVWIDGLIAYSYFKLRRGFTIHDRWLYDIPAFFRLRQYSNKFIEHLMLNCFPRPDALILLTVPPEVARSRKQNDPGHTEHGIEFYRDLSEHVMAIAMTKKYDRVIDASQPAEDIAGDILEVILSEQLRCEHRQ